MSKFTRSVLAALAVAIPLFGPAPAHADEPTLIMLGNRDEQHPHDHRRAG
ncbi:hypothetical protein [Nocardia aurantia]|uniref:Uncharacterized protein n=1 Tax=Nocardia aurantia TaxID=2585199 RepID=A0A7K0DV72_9NOCA|nr:hypothetical protein [Nocardia aurantia]MQY29666.1 hypothetical protein [Nocardia aurantia]